MTSFSSSSSSHEEAAQSVWTGMDDYLSAHLYHDDPILSQVLQTSAEHGLPPHSVSPLQGQLLHILALTCQAKRILEVGTLGGYSTIHLARALPSGHQGGQLITLENNAHHAQIARMNLEHAALTDRVRIVLGDAATSMQSLIQQHSETFDLIFIDADKQSNRVYYEAALQLSHEGTLIIVDNIVRNGVVQDANIAQQDPSVRGVREWLEAVKQDQRVLATGIQTVGCKGYDGFALLRVVKLQR